MCTVRASMVIHVGQNTQGNVLGKKYSQQSLSGFCHFGLVLFMVLWQSPDTPILSCFHVSMQLRMCSSRALSLCMPCFTLERGVRIPALMSWVSVSCRGSDTRALHSVSLYECAVSSSLGHTLFCPRVFCCVARSLCFIGCVHSCYILCSVARSLCISLAACFHVVMSFLNTWLMSFLICCVFMSCFAHGWWFVCWPCACVFVCVSTWLLS